MKIVRTKAEVRKTVAEARWGRGAPGRRIALVPTMGSLHDGHLSLVDRARQRADFVVLSIYVNPLQFGPAEDFAQYPRDLDQDVALAEGRGVDLVFVPSDAEMYPAGEPVVRVAPGRLADRLCGAFRPGHFEGVLTVVAKLFNIVQPDVAVFGQKDYQQAVLIRRMVADLDLPIEVEVAPIIRAADGLALSSRNTYLSPAERKQAAGLSRALGRAEAAFRAGERVASRLRALVEETLTAEPGLRVQYIELAHPETLEPVEEATPGCVLAVAAFVGRTRLIDNTILS